MNLDEHLPLVEAIARRVAATLWPPVDARELFTPGWMGLVDAAEKFDPSKGARFTTYASWRVWGEIMEELRRWEYFPRRKGAQIMYLDRPIEDDGSGRPVTLLDQFFDPNDDPTRDAEVESRLDALDESVRELPNRERLAVALVYYDGLYQRQAADIMGVTEGRVCQILGDAERMLRLDIDKLEGPRIRPEHSRAKVIGSARVIDLKAALEEWERERFVLAVRPPDPAHRKERDREPAGYADLRTRRRLRQRNRVARA